MKTVVETSLIFALALFVFFLIGCDSESKQARPGHAMHSDQDIVLDKAPEPEKKTIEKETMKKEIENKPQNICPVMGGKINKNVFSDHEGKRVYFCCAGCISTFKKNPDTHIKKLESDGVVLDKTPESTSSKPNTTRRPAAKRSGCGG